jgi:hypothetical protein
VNPLRLLLFLAWRLCPPVNVRVFARVMREAVGLHHAGAAEISLILIRVCWGQCTRLERAFLLWLHPPLGLLIRIAEAA